MMRALEVKLYSISIVSMPTKSDTLFFCLHLSVSLSACKQSISNKYEQQNHTATNSSMGCQKRGEDQYTESWENS